MVNPDFAAWATSFTGCNGGNLAGKVWVCGIEYGASPLPDDPPYVVVENPCFVEDRNDFLRYQYNWKAVKLLTALAGGDVRKYRSFFNQERCFDQHSDSFKLNLYPIGFPDTSHRHWPDWLYDRTGFNNKREYLSWCRNHRFPVLRSWASKYLPEIIICTGRMFENEFKEAFGDVDVPMNIVEAGGKPISYFVTNSGKTLIAIVSFLGGRHGLNSNLRISATGKQLAELRNAIDRRR